MKQRGGKNLQTLLKGGSRTWFISLTYNPSKDTSVEARDAQVIFGSRGIRTETLTVTQCRARTTYVDAKVTCISRGSLGKANCGVDALREMPDPPANPRESVLDNFGYAFATLDEYMDMLDEVASGRSSNLEYYLADPLTAYSILEDNRADAVLADLDIRLFERRFALLWNTFWKASWARKSIMGGNMTGAYYAPVSRSLMTTLINTTSTTVFPLPPVYAVDRVWLSIYFVSVGVMLLAAVFGLVMRALCRAPVLLGYVSSLTRDSAYFEDCGLHLNSAEDGSERSKRLGKTRVMVAAVGGKEGACTIAFAPAEIGTRIEKGKCYD